MAENADFGDAIPFCADTADGRGLVRELIDIRHDHSVMTNGNNEFRFLVSGEIMYADDNIALALIQRGFPASRAGYGYLAALDARLIGSFGHLESQAAGAAEIILVQADDEGLGFDVAVGACLGRCRKGQKREH